MKNISGQLLKRLSAILSTICDIYQRLTWDRSAIRSVLDRICAVATYNLLTTSSVPGLKRAILASPSLNRTKKLFRIERGDAGKTLFSKLSSYNAHQVLYEPQLCKGKEGDWIKSRAADAAGPDFLSIYARPLAVRKKKGLTKGDTLSSLCERSGSMSGQAIAVDVTTSFNQLLHDTSEKVTGATGSIIRNTI
ncbi:hypothetical protein OUZ56_024831 [Daphnia magna]|uniref:Uncharacterized protein n=1 Tax=Daphnia magna TaxID=35525 RepID=A0ABQ9ZI43_9CRUS|nr:hypothetical protein OUZ56_024831 [Daphnia magna]